MSPVADASCDCSAAAREQAQFVALVRSCYATMRPVADAASGEFQCHLCPATFKEWRALSLHRRRVELFISSFPQFHCAYDTTH
eukprot:4141769-Amphidinium_carterae.1